MDVASVHVSPKSTLNVHQNNCVQKMLRELNFVEEDFRSAADVCIRFQECAADCFKSNKKRNCKNHNNKLVITLPQEPSETFAYLNDKAQTVVSKREEKILQLMLTDGEKMPRPRKMRAYNLTLLSNKSRFEILEKLLFFRPSPLDYLLDSPPQALHISCPYLTQKQYWLMREFPQLEHVEFDSIDNLTDDTLLTFLAYNPQLQRVKIINCDGMTWSFLSVFGDYAQNLTHLHISQFDFFKNDRGFSTLACYQKHVLEPLGKLRRLKCLSIENSNKFLLEVMINSMAVGTVPIESLSFSPMESLYLTECVRTVPTLKYLRLTGKFSVRTFDEIMSTQFNLERIVLNFHLFDFRLFSVSANFLSHIRRREFDRDLCKLSFNVYCRKDGIDAHTFDSMVLLAKGCIEGVRIQVNKGRVRVPDDVLKNNSKWVYISYK